MKRLLSWIVLLLGQFLLELLVRIDSRVLAFFLNWFCEMSTIQRIIAYVLGGGFVIMIAFAPVSIATPAIAAASDTVCSTRKGFRFKALGWYNLSWAALTVILMFTGILRVNSIIGIYQLLIYALHGLLLINIGKHTGIK